ncbi:MAG: PLP-dependent cysteine synthase family protein [Promethearchaeota archaeon]|nr:MAG: PLP-dependent cysteine synthase family protein [Candidatus Lokiarchaeota archaeon]
MRYYSNILKLIGRTPLVRINKSNPNPNVLMLAKLEKYNPAGSVKDRIAITMIEEAEKTGEITPGKIVIEPSSGNTGIGLSLICAVKGYPLEIVMPETMSVERRKIMTAYGAKITLTSGDKGMNGAQDYVKELVEQNPDKYFFPNQFANENNPLAHYRYTAEEIIEDTDGEIDVFIAGLGTSGTLMGVSRRLKEYNPNIKIIAVEPEAEEPIQGLKSLKTSYIPDIYDESQIDEKEYVKEEDAEHASRMLSLQEGIFTGISSGAAMHVAINTASNMESGTLVVLLPDGGEKYISHPIFAPEKCLECTKKCKIMTLWDDKYIASISDWWENST